jgi:formylglycine-generating enzyme required for sulfatase activity
MPTIRIDFAIGSIHATLQNSGNGDQHLPRHLEADPSRVMPSVRLSATARITAPRWWLSPRGKFTIGTPASEVGRGSDENPQQVVTIGYALAVGKYPVTRGEFAAFVKDTRQTLGACEHWDGKSFRVEKAMNWSNTFHQTDRSAAK